MQHLMHSSLGTHQNIILKLMENTQIYFLNIFKTNKNKMIKDKIKYHLFGMQEDIELIF